MNRTITVNVPHQLTQDEARARIQKGIADARTQFAGKVAQVEEAWAGNRLEFKLAVMGQAVTGRVDVEPSSVAINVDLPWLLAMLADKISPQIKTHAGKLLENKPK